MILQKLMGSVRSLNRIPKDLNLKIYNAEKDDSFYKVFNRKLQYVCSAFLPNAKPGQQIEEGVYCQNLESLTFDDSIFDLVITEDVFEHLRNFEKGFREVFRVLKAGGYHIFTVPFYFDKPTLARVDTTQDKDVPLLPVEYHGDKIRGKIIAYRTFGLDLFEILKTIGFDTEVDFSKYTDQKHGIFDSYVFVSKKVG